MNAKILIVTSKSAGGSGKHIETLASGLKAKGIRADLIYFRNGFQQDNDIEMNFSNVVNFPRRVGMNQHLFRNILYLIKIIKKGNYDIIHCHTSLGGLIARCAAVFSHHRKVKVIHTLHAYGADQFTPQPQWTFFFIIEKILDLLTTRYVAPSNFTAKYGVRINLFNSSKVSVIHNSLELSPPTKKILSEGQHTRKLLGFNDEDVVFLFCGRFEEQKGLADLLKAWAKFNKICSRSKLILVGDGGMKHSLELMAKELKISDDVSFLGWQEHTEKYYAAADVFIMSSIWESFGLVFLDAMNFSLPIIATNTQGIPEVVENSVSGLLSDVGDTESLVENMLKLYKSRLLREKFGNAGNVRLHDLFSFERFIDEHISLYENILERG